MTSFEQVFYGGPARCDDRCTGLLPGAVRVLARSSIVRAAVLGLAVAAAAVAVVVLARADAAPQAPVFLEQQLGAQVGPTLSVYRPAPGVRVALGPASGFSLQAGRLKASIASADTSGDGWRAHAGGAIRATGFGSELVLVQPRSTEQFLTVTSHQGVSTWEWALASSIGRPRVGDDGFVAFVDASGAVRQEILVKPPQILDAAGRRITPSGMRWSLAQNGAGEWLLQLRLDDRALPLPYVIDPALETGASTGTGSGSVSVPNNVSTNVVTTTPPAGIVSGDLLVMSEVFRLNTTTSTAANFTISTPTGGGSWRQARGTTQVSGSANTFMRIYFNQYDGSAGDFRSPITQKNGTQIVDGATQVAAFTGVAGLLAQLDMNDDSGYAAAGPTAASLAATATTMTDHTLVLHAAAVNDVPATLDAPGGMTPANPFSSSSGADRVSNLLSYELDSTPAGTANEAGSSAGTSQTYTATTSGGSPTEYLSMVVAFRPDDTTPPVLSSAATDGAGTTVMLSYTEAGGSSGASGFNKTIVPDPSRFVVHSSGAADQVPTSVTIGGTATAPTVTLGGLTLEDGRTITVDYASATATKDVGNAAISSSISTAAPISGFSPSGFMSIVLRHTFSTNTGVGTFSYGSWTGSTFSNVARYLSTYYSTDFQFLGAGALSQGLQDLNGNQAADLSGASVVNNVGPAPWVSSVSTTAASGTTYYKAGDTITITVDFDHAVDVVTTLGTPTLALNTTPSQTASCAAQTGVTAVACTYTVQAGDSAAALDYVNAGSLALNGGAIVADGYGRAARLTLPAPSTFGGKTLTVDSAIPTIGSVALASLSPAAATNNGQPVALKQGNTVYYRATTGAANHFQLAVTATDTGGSGLKDGSFPALGGTVGSWLHSAQPSVAQTGGVVTSTSNFAWSDNESASPTEDITVRDNSLNVSAPTTLTFTADGTAPSTTDSAASLTPRTDGTTVTLSPSDSGSGVAATFYTVDGSTPTINAAGVPQGTTTAGTTVTIPSTEGSYTVKYFSVDAVGNKEAVQTAAAIVVDRTRPVITGLQAPLANAFGWNRANVTVSFSCADNAGGSGIASNTVAGDTLTANGAGQSVANTGTCVDKVGNVAAAATVDGINIDKINPVLAPTVSPNPVALNGAASALANATDALSGLDTFGCAAVDTGAIGSFTVSCTAADKAGNTKSVAVSFVVSAKASKQAVLVEVNAALARASFGDRPELGSAAFQLRDSLDSFAWVDGNHLRSSRGDRVFDDEKLAVYYFEQLLGDRFSRVPDATLKDWIDTLVTVDRALAQIAIDDATAAGGDSSKLASAATEMAKAASDLARGRETSAIDHYRYAWRYAKDALR